MITENDKIEINNTFTMFINEMYEWEKYCNLLDKDTTLSNEEKTPKQREKIQDIFNKYCTKKERKEGLPNIISYRIIEPNDKIIEERIITIEESSKYKAILYSEQDDSMESKYQYIFEKKKGKWLIDSKKRYSNWKKKWVIESL